MVATSAGRVSSTLTLTRSRNVTPASSSTRLMLRTTKPNCASNASGSFPCSSKPGMPDMNSRSPVRVAKESGGALTPAGGGKCLMADMGYLGADSACSYHVAHPAATHGPGPARRRYFPIHMSNSDQGYGFAFSRHGMPELCVLFALQENRGRGEDRVRAAPAVSCAICAKECAHEHTGSAETHRPSLRNGFTVYIALSPVNGFLATVALQITPQDLTPASGRQDHTILPYA